MIKQIDSDTNRGGAELEHARGEVWIQLVEHQQAAAQQDVVMVRLRRHLARSRGLGERVALDQGDLIEAGRQQPCSHQPDDASSDDDCVPAQFFSRLHLDSPAKVLVAPARYDVMAVR
ncbi:hypothetical protein D3C81_1616910 [compost metagenome]